MVRDALTGKMVPVTSLIGQIESALVRGGGARPKIPDKGIPRDGHKDDTKTALWASYDSNVNVLPATKLQFDCEFSEVPGKVVVRAEGAQFRVTFRNTSIVGVRMDGRGGFFHVYFDGTLSKGFATRSGPADYELYNGIQGQHSVKIVKSSAGGTSKDRTFEVFGLILSNDGRVVERLGDHRPKTPPPRSRRGAAADKLKTRGATSKSFSHGPAGATVVVEMDKSNLGIHHSALTITRLASKGQALQRGVRVGWKVTHVEGNPVFDSKSFKAELIRARQKRARFTMSFQVPAGNEYRVKAPQPPQKKPDTKQQTKSGVCRFII